MSQCCSIVFDITYVADKLSYVGIYIVSDKHGTLLQTQEYTKTLHQIVIASVMSQHCGGSLLIKCICCLFFSYDIVLIILNHYNRLETLIVIIPLFNCYRHKSDNALLSLKNLAFILLFCTMAIIYPMGRGR